jgi:hypothetical protein
MTSDQVFSPSADPIGAARHLFGLSPASAEPDQPAEPGPSAQPTDAQEGVLAYAWTALMNRSLELTGDDVEGLPRSYAISKYEARLKRSSLGRQWQARMTSLVLGTPIYVAQVT